MRVLALLMLTVGAFPTNQPSPPRVRSEDPSIAAVIEKATVRSPTFRRLIETIQATDGLVYVSEGKCWRSVRACLSLSVQLSGPYRMLRVIVDPRAAECDLMASIGHELQHAVELLRNPRVADSHSAYLFFDHEGPTDSQRFETEAAIHAGNQVGKEVCRRVPH